jgi:hypothetical protein
MRNGEQVKWDVMADTWAGTDGLGRALPDAAVCGPPRADRFVGIFYFICLQGRGAPNDVSRIKAENPSNPAWGPPGSAHHWGEPELGYYRSTDEWVIRRHAYQLADAGIDTLIFDTTNDRSFPETYSAVAEVFTRIRAEGERTPQFCFLASRESVRQLWNDLYAPGRYRDLWFQWRGRPLLLFGQHFNMCEAEDFPQEIQDFFTLRAGWAWDSLPWYRDGHDQWPWVAHYPQCVGWHEGPEHREQVPVCIAQHPLSNIGRSFHNGEQPTVDELDLTPYTPQGLCFEEQWQRAHEVDPEFVFVTGWNEWAAGRVEMGEDVDACLRHWCFYPGARLGLAGRELKPGDAYFIDQYNQEYSRDAEPMHGGHTDNYYYQLVSHVRRFKGVRAPVPVSDPVTIDLAASFAQWQHVAPEYRDHLYDTVDRREQGYGDVGVLTHAAGRNEFVACKVARDRENLFFYVRTRAPITPWTDPDWMMLLLKTTADPVLGWEGYDFLINWPVIDGRTTTVSRNTGGWSWAQVGRVQYRVAGQELMLAVPRAMLGLGPGAFTLDFHWLDNPQPVGSIEGVFAAGDSAPPRRFDYRYRCG